VSPHFLQLVDDTIASTIILAVAPMLGLFGGFLMWLDAYEEPRKPSFARAMVWFLVLVLALGNVAARLMYHEAATQVATSINSQIASWQPVILDNGTFDNSATSCQEPTITRYGQIPLVFEFASVPGTPMRVNVKDIPHVGTIPGEQQASDGQVYVYVDRSIPVSSYRCSVQDGVLDTRLSLTSDDLMVMYPADDGKPVGLGSYYIETELRPLGGSHLSSCVLSTATTSRNDGSPGPTTVFSVVNATENDTVTYRAKVFQATAVVESDSVKVNNAVQSDDLPFVLRDTLFDNFDGWVKLAIYKVNGLVKFLVNDRVVATFTEHDTGWVYPQLGTQAGTTTAGGTAACEFRYLRAYTTG
jgi:hypothetical protein